MEIRQWLCEMQSDNSNSVHSYINRLRTITLYFAFSEVNLNFWEMKVCNNNKNVKNVKQNGKKKTKNHKFDFTREFFWACFHAIIWTLIYTLTTLILTSDLFPRKYFCWYLLILLWLRNLAVTMVPLPRRYRKLEMAETIFCYRPYS